jgi:cyclopropane-fatty-acyl-phospholipid synthase
MHGNAEVLRRIPAGVPLANRLAARLALAALARWRVGRLDLRLPDGSLHSFGSDASRRRVSVSVRDWRFFWRLLTSADVGAGESYMAGEWECSNLVELCRMVAEDQAPLPTASAWSWLHRLAQIVRQRKQRNTLAGSRRNVAYHYDIGNDLYRLFLDDSLTYSAAYFPAADSTLEEAQRHKLDGICRRLDLKPGQHILEIGSGWGSFAMHAARNYGCRVTSLTLSHEQLQLARKRVREAGLDSSVEILLCDYRRIAGRFDHIASIEMFEAVGYENYPAFFRVCERLLAPEGRLFLQAITIPDQRFDAYRRDFDWNRKYIFPGSQLASIHAIAEATKRHTNLRIDWMRDIGPHYARTLRCWRERFLARLAEVRALGFDERFIRMWEFYLASCEASFAARYTGDVQMLLARPLPYARRLQAAASSSAS